MKCDRKDCPVHRKDGSLKLSNSKEELHHFLDTEYD